MVNAAKTTALHLDIISRFADLAKLAPAWREVMERSDANEPMMSPNWLLPWWEIYGGGRRLCAGAIYSDGRLVALAPLQRRRRWDRTGVPFRSLELLGSNEAEDDGVCSEYLNLIIERDFETPVLQLLAEAILEGRFGAWDELVIPAMQGESRLLDPLADSFRRVGLDVVLSETSAAPYISLPSSWNEYLQSLGRHRRIVKNTLRDFNAWAAGTDKFQQAGAAQELEKGKRILAELHARRWQGAGQNGAFAASRFSAFHDQVMTRFFEQDALQLCWLSAHGKPVAAIYNLVWNNKVYFYQSGRTLDVPKGIRAGIALHTYCIRIAIESGCREYDFLAGAAQYKKQLAQKSRPIVQFRAVRPALRETMRSHVNQGISMLRHVRNKLRGSASVNAD